MLQNLCVLGILMADILEHEGYFWVPDFCPEQIVMIVLQLSIGEMVPSVEMRRPWNR